MNDFRQNRRFGLLVVLALVVFCGISEKAALSQLTCEQTSSPTCGGLCPLGMECVTDQVTGKCVCQPMFPPNGTDLSPTTWNLRLQGFGAGTTDVQLTGDVIMGWQDPFTDPGQESGACRPKFSRWICRDRIRVLEY